MRNRRRLPYITLILFLFCFSVYIAWRVPYTHDDWDWGREMGITYWLTGTFNNRYVGSFFVILMTRSPIFKTLIMAVTMTCLPLLCAYLSNTPPRNHVYSSILTYFVAFAMPVITWRQTYGWVAGFSNFTMGSLFLMALLSVLKYFLQSPRHSRLVCSVSFLLGFAAQLCSENISFFFPFFLVAIILLTRVWKRPEQRTVFLFALFGTILGTALMFFNPLYVKLATTGVSKEQFRSLTFSLSDPFITILHSLMSHFFCNILPSLYETHPVLVIFLSFGVWLDLFPVRRNVAFGLSLPMLLYGIGCCYCAVQMRQTFDWQPASLTLRTIGAIGFTVLWFISVWLSPHAHKWRVLAFSLFAFALVTPFAVISNMGPRCYHISHFCLLTAGASLYDRVHFNRPGKLLVCTALALTIARLTLAYTAIGACTELRQELTEQALQAQSDTLVLPSVSSRYTYSWGYNPQSDLRAEHYREYYGLPENMTLIFLPYDSADLWPDIPEQMYEDAMIYPGT